MTEHIKVSLALLLVLAAGAAADNYDLADHYGFVGIEIYKVNENSFNLAVGDMNRDGRLDMAVVNNSQSRIELFLHREPGQEQPPQLINVEDDVNWLRDDTSFIRKNYWLDVAVVAFALGDVTADKLPDLVFAADNKKLYLSPQVPNGWGERQEFALKSVAANKNAVKICDLNRDGANDILVICPEQVYVYYQKGPGQFASLPNAITNLYKSPGDILIGDLNGDGLPDLLTFYPDQQESLTCRLQGRAGEFPFEMVLRVPQVRSVNVYDADGDGSCEIYTIHKTTGRLQVYTLARRTDSTLGQLTLFPFDAAKEGEKRAIIAGDIDGDGRADVAVTEPSTAQIMFYRQLANGSLDSPEYFPCCEDASGLFYLGEKRLVVFSAAESMIGIIHFEHGRLTFPKALEIPGKPLCMDCRDFSGDGLADIIYATKTKSDVELYFLTQDNGGNFVPQTPVKLEKLASAPNQLKILDLNQDGLIDLVLALPYVGTQIYLQRAGGKFELLQSQSGLTMLKDLPFYQMAEADVDGDGKRELLLARNNYVRALTVTGNGNLDILDQFHCDDSGAKITAVMMEDADGDGIAEMLLMDQNQNSIVVLKQDDRGMFRETSRETVVAFNFRGWQSIDLNGDAAKDLLIADTRRFGILYLRGPQYHLKEKSTYECKIQGASYKDMVIGDVNGDGKSDIVVAETAHHILDILTWQAGDLLPAMKFQIFEQASLGQSRQSHQIGVREMAIKDVNGDGKDDLLVLIHDRILVYPQD